MNKPKVIAFYLPQYHPTPDNDKWWGKGFTEWTNVGKAKPLFHGHYQPKVPADLGYYDLRLPEVREAQTELAKEAGIYGFCYYHYWFGNGKEELEFPFNEVLRLGKPNFPFMLCWANESWHKKFWDKDGKGSSKEVLVEQTYPGEQDIVDHFYRLLPAFKDPRYIKEDGKPLFMIYKPLEYAEVDKFIKKWNELAVKEGLPGFVFIGHMQTCFDIETKNSLIQKGFTYCNTVNLVEIIKKGKMSYLANKIIRLFFNIPIIRRYDKISKYFETNIDHCNDVIPSIIPNWDHTPRSGERGIVLIGSTPKNVTKHLKRMIEIQNAKEIKNKYLFLKSWNEWGEGNYIEPDLKYGKDYIRIFHQELNKS